MLPWSLCSRRGFEFQKVAPADSVDHLSDKVKPAAGLITGSLTQELFVTMCERVPHPRRRRYLTLPFIKAICDKLIAVLRKIPAGIAEYPHDAFPHDDVL